MERQVKRGDAHTLAKGAGVALPPSTCCSLLPTLHLLLLPPTLHLLLLPSTLHLLLLEEGAPSYAPPAAPSLHLLPPFSPCYYQHAHDSCMPQ